MHFASATGGELPAEIRRMVVYVRQIREEAPVDGFFRVSGTVASPTTGAEVNFEGVPRGHDVFRQLKVALFEDELIELGWLEDSFDDLSLMPGRPAKKLFDTRMLNDTQIKAPPAAQFANLGEQFTNLGNITKDAATITMEAFEQNLFGQPVHVIQVSSGTNPPEVRIYKKPGLRDRMMTFDDDEPV